jgi:hypothetical protein
MHTLAEIFGFLAVPVGVARFQFRERRSLVLLTALMSALMSAHYGLDGDRTSCLVTAMVTVSGLVSAFRRAETPLAARAAFALAAVVGVCVVAPPRDALAALPILGFAVARLGEMCRSDMAVRASLAGRSLLWLLYVASRRDAPAMLLEAANLVSNAVGVWRRVRRGSSVWTLRPRALATPAGGCV